MNRIKKLLNDYKFYIFAIISTLFWVFLSHYRYAKHLSLDSMNAEVLLFNYSYGFIPRALIGHIYFLLGGTNDIKQVLCFLIVMHIVLSLCIIALWMLILRKVPDFRYKRVTSFFVLFGLIASFSGRANLGRSDQLLIVIAFLSIVFLIYDKYLFLLPILAIIGSCTHEGFTFLYANVLLVGLLYKYATTNKFKYLISFFFTFLCVCIFFLYFAFVGNHNELAYNTISELSKEMMGYGYYEEFLSAEFLGVNLFKHELVARPRAFFEFGLWILFLYPFVKRVVGYVISLCKTKEFEHLLMAMGILTLLPEYLLKLDFGRWTMALLIYLVLITLLALSSDDKIVEVLITPIFNNWVDKEKLHGKIGYCITSPFAAQAMCEATLLIFAYVTKLI